MNILDIVGVVVALSLSGMMIVVLLIIAWSMFEETELGQIVIERLKGEER